MDLKLISVGLQEYAAVAIEKAKPVIRTALRPARALRLAYGHVLTGTKVTTPTAWKDI